MTCYHLQWFADKKFMTLNLACIGGTGGMLSPSAKHLKNDLAGKIIRVYDRKQPGHDRDLMRQAWIEYGARLVDHYDALIADDIDGVIVCVGKNGDDLAIIKTLVSRLKTQPNRFIVSFSTVSTEFVRQATFYADQHGVTFANYPLTGGPLGARNANMLILSGGPEVLFQRLKPFLSQIGHPKYLGASQTIATETKLINHYLVFSGLTGICSGISLAANSQKLLLSDPDLVATFDFLNAGAGGTKQWEISVRKGLTDNQWSEGFLIKHALIDALYAIQLGIEAKLSLFSIIAMVNIVLAFIYVITKHPAENYATHAILQEMIASQVDEFDQFIQANMTITDAQGMLSRCIDLLPAGYRQTALMDVSAQSFLY